MAITTWPIGTSRSGERWPRAIVGDGPSPRPQKRVTPVYRDLADYAVLSRELVIGRIYEDRTAPEELRWYWTLNGVHAPQIVTTSGKVATLEQAKAQLAAQWQKWLDWAGLQEFEPTPKAPAC